MDKERGVFIVYNHIVTSKVYKIELLGAVANRFWVSQEEAGATKRCGVVGAAKERHSSERPDLEARGVNAACDTKQNKGRCILNSSRI